MFALIPALLRDAQAEQSLLRTLSRFPPNMPAALVLVTQGRQFSVPSLVGIRAVTHKHFDRPIGKWSAIRHGLSLIPSNIDDPVLLLDADDPIADASMVSAFEAAALLHPDFMIGERKTILLHADDQLGPQSRVFVEIFSNTLLLLTLQVLRPIPDKGPDIQSGLYLLSGRARRAISLEYVTDYGGELALYYELANAGLAPSSLAIETNKVTPSSYSVENIVRSIAALPFFRPVSRDRLLEALHLAPRLYARYLVQGSEEQFRHEIVPALRRVFPAFAGEVT